ncbi:TatD family Mg-dependent DNase [Aeromonas diversa CDC 2478-85]|uniref:TatD family Mg-dependent DNase n=1 Tax=Aeromonas diversa CDC 2478-85 TaxID=1268237 RepID=N9VFB4_9GAMM|nr:TatD family hydrolase [Aeromonas diversa]ENY73957.1 TatD family Mg-dependent DNase [Aeromonas diversa CDC 2478-85]
MYLIDTHCHLDFADFDADRHAVLAASRARGVTQYIIPAIGEENWDSVAALAAREPGMAYGLGVHPMWAARQAPGVLMRLDARLSARPAGLVAIGECGLDGRSTVEQSGQLALFEGQLRLAGEYGLPLLVHSVRANDTVAGLLKRHRPPAGGVIHAFSGSPHQAERFWGLGFRLGIGGTITYERANKTREAVAAMPWEALVLETDAPDMPLYGRQGERNSPEYLPEVLQVLADLKGEDPSEVAKLLHRSTRQLFPSLDTIFNN